MASQFPNEEHPVDAVSPLGDFPRAAKKSPELSILVEDDELLIRWSLAETLSEAGHRVVEAGDGRAAIQAVMTTSRPFDVVLLDFRLPDSDDLTLLSRLRRLAPRARIIMMTAFGTAEMTQDARDLGAYDVVAKPFEMQDVERLVRASDSRW
ncbi:MAG: response regulator [Acidimicrobiia bacterium]|nr:response regulator [Acidimicrobiia bacterium]